MNKIKVFQRGVIAVALWTAVWLADGIGATFKELVAAGIILLLACMIFLVQRYYEGCLDKPDCNQQQD